MATLESGLARASAVPAPPSAGTAHGASAVLEALEAPSSLSRFAQRKPPVDRWVSGARVKAGSELDRQWLLDDEEAVAGFTQRGGEGIARSWSMRGRPCRSRTAPRSRARLVARAGPRKR